VRGVWRPAGGGAEAALGGIYVIRTSLSPDALLAAGAVDPYTKLENVERDVPPENRPFDSGPSATGWRTGSAPTC